MHAERDMVVPIPLVRLSVRPSAAGIMSKRMDIISSRVFFGLSGRSIILAFFRVPPPLESFKCGRKKYGVGNFF